MALELPFNQMYVANRNVCQKLIFAIETSPEIYLTIDKCQMRAKIISIW